MAVLIPGLYGLDSASAWRTLQKDPQKYIDRFSKDKGVQKEIEYFAKKAPTLTSVDALMKDRRALQYVLDSYGLGSEINNAGRIKKILTEDPTNSNSLVNKLADTKFKTMATALRMDQGSTTLQNLVSTGALKTSYIQNEFEEALGDQDAALRQAAYFARNSGTISNVYSILGDKILRDVVTSTFNLPKELAIQKIETQAKVVAGRVDITKFAALAGNSTVSATQLANAKADHTLIGNNLAISDSAIKQITALQKQLTQLATDYSNLNAITDPSGANSATIAIQNDAVPELVRFDEMMQAGSRSMTTVQSGLTTLKSIIDQAGKSGSDLPALKAQFSSVISSMNTAINNAAVTAPDGSTQNILLSGVNDVQTVTFDAQGNSVSMNRFDATTIQNYLTTAASAFDAVTSSGDTAALTTATSRILQGMDVATKITTKLTADQAAFTSNITSNGFFAATLNSTDLLKGKQSVDDSLSRISKIETVLTNIGKLATQSKAMAAGADRTALETQFNAYKTELRGLIENAGAGFDNFLNNIPDQSYEIVGGKSIAVKGGFNLAATVADVIDSGSLSDATLASDLEVKTIQVTTYTDRAKKSLNESKPILDRTVNTFDPRGRLDSQITDLKNNIETMIAAAASGTNNLLGANQNNIRLDSLSTGTILTFRAQTTFKQDYTDALNGILAQLGNGTTAIVNSIDDGLETINRVKRNLESDNRVATIEYGKLGGTIDTLDPKNTSTTSELYKTNTFTAKFISRYLVMNGSDGSSSSGSTNYLANLFGATDTASSMANLMSLATSLRA
jgi:Protein of unknown function (DUF1217)